MHRFMAVAILPILILLPLSIPLLRVQSAHAQTYPTVTITTNPSQITLPVGGSATTQLTVTSVNGYAGTTTLTTAAYPYPQVNVTLNPSSVTLATGGTATTTTTVTANTTSTPATYLIRIYAHNGTYDTTYDFNATVTPATTTTPDFRLSASQTTIPVPPFSSTNVTISITSLASYSGDINMTNAPVIGILSPRMIHLNSRQIANVTLTLKGSCPFPGSNLRQSFELDAKSGARFHWIDLQYYYQTSTPVFCFLSLISQKIVIGSSAPNAITFWTLGGFASTVTLSASSSLQTVFFPTNRILVQQGAIDSGSVSLTITVPASTLPGNYTLTITGTSGSQTWSQNDTIQAVSGQYYTMIVSPSTLTIPQGSTRSLSVSLTGQAGFSVNVELLPFASNKNLTFDVFPIQGYNGLHVNAGYPTQATITIYTSNVPVGNYSLMVFVETLYMPYVYAMQIVPITVQAASPNILGLSPIVFYSLVGAIVGGAAITSTVIFLRKKKRSNVPQTAGGFQKSSIILINRTIGGIWTEQA